jgi:hypothetical protein
MLELPVCLKSGQCNAPILEEARVGIVGKESHFRLLLSVENVVGRERERSIERSKHRRLTYSWKRVGTIRCELVGCICCVLNASALGSRSTEGRNARKVTARAERDAFGLPQ